jgi:hypothetical protein
MENTQQEQDNAVKEDASEIPSQESANNNFDSIADIWMKTANSYWDAFILKQTDKKVADYPYLPKFLTNGAATRTKNAWNTYVSMCKSLSQAMMDPNTLDSYIKASDDLPETLLKMQRTEMDRFFKWHSDMLDKSANFEKLTQLMSFKAFM